MRVVLGNIANPAGLIHPDSVGFLGAGHVPIDPKYAGLVTEGEGATVGVLPGRPAGRMRVQFGIHGGVKGFLDVIEGLVQRNARAIREGYPPTHAKRRGFKVGFKEDHIWRDIPTALSDGSAGAGTFAVWRAAEARAKGDQSLRVAMVNGIPMVARIDGSGQVVSGSIEDPTPGRMLNRGYGKVRPATGSMGKQEGVSRDWMTLTIDDDQALPVSEINTAIAKHNARRIQRKGLPPLYESGVRYKVEGSPELWWDAEEILAKGFDDCEGLAAYRAGELMLQGYDAKVWCRQITKPASFAGGKPGGRLFHAITKVDGRWDEAGNYHQIHAPDGTPVYDDPSASIGHRGYWLRKTGGKGNPKASMPVPDWYLQHSRRRRAAGRDL